MPTPKLTFVDWLDPPNSAVAIPQQRTLPSTSKAHECDPEVTAAARTPPRSTFDVGVPPPIPICPPELLPQQRTPPSEITTHVCCPAARRSFTGRCRSTAPLAGLMVSAARPEVATVTPTRIFDRVDKRDLPRNRFAVVAVGWGKFPVDIWDFWSTHSE